MAEARAVDDTDTTLHMQWGAKLHVIKEKKQKKNNLKLNTNCVACRYAGTDFTQTMPALYQ